MKFDSPTKAKASTEMDIDPYTAKPEYVIDQK